MVVAALLVVIFVFDSVGPAFGIGLLVVSIAGCLGYRHFRSRNPEKPPSIDCLRCGETLSLTARHCNACGSASWTLKN
jgi:hypothetical protein